MTTLELSIESDGSTRVGDRFFRFTSEEAKKGAVPPTARTLIQEGYDPETTAHVVYFGVPAFTTELTLEQWAQETEPGQRGLKVHPLLLAKLGL